MSVHQISSTFITSALGHPYISNLRGIVNTAYMLAIVLIKNIANAPKIRYLTESRIFSQFIAVLKVPFELILRFFILLYNRMGTNPEIDNAIWLYSLSRMPFFFNKNPF